MPVKKRIHTTFTDSFPLQAINKQDQTRQVIAAEAARIMVTQSQFNYRIAKQKAAERLRIHSGAAMPSNAEIESALRAYQTFYGGQQHSSHLQKLRSKALTVMRFLQVFRPRLVGPVLDGTADEHARVSIHVFNDPPDAVALYLLDNKMVFHDELRKIRWHDGSYRHVPQLVTGIEDVEVELTLFGCLGLRQAPLSPVDGRPLKRAPLSQVECLLANV